MSERLKRIIMFSLFLFPTIVYASGFFEEFDMPVYSAIFMEAFVSIHMSLGVLKPLSEVISPENSKKTFWILFAIRAAILLFCDFFVTTAIAMVDFFGVFIGVMIVVPIATAIAKKKGKIPTVFQTISIPAKTPEAPTAVTGVELKCAKCGGVLQVTDKFCGSCGAPFDGNNVVVSAKEGAVIPQPPKQKVLPSAFDPMYVLPEDKLVELFIEKELKKAGVENLTLIPSDALRRKNLLNVIFAILVFVFVSIIFFHFPIYTYLVGLIILLIFSIIKNRFNIMKYLVKQVKSRPGEKISNIVMSVKNTFVADTSKRTGLVYLLVAAIIPLIIFSTPKIIYEKIDGGYGVRYYIYGLTNMTNVTIPEEHNGEKVISLRGNTFSNMPLLKTVTLPNSIKEIRGQAFYNCYKLESVKLPSNLEYLGGGAFANTKSLVTVELPNTLTYLGGEAFLNSSIEHITLSENLTEIRGNTFENCTNLISIVIPDSVTRIGGHAFYGDSKLSSVKISANSKLSEIGSSAFRRCSSLTSITIPQNTSVNTRAFKESPTNVQRYGSSLYNY